MVSLHFYQFVQRDFFVHWRRAIPLHPYEDPLTRPTWRGSSIRCTQSPQDPRWPNNFVSRSDHVLGLVYLRQTFVHCCQTSASTCPCVCATSSSRRSSSS